MFTKQDLLHQRHTIDKLRNQSVLTPQHAEKIEQSIASSWQRSASADIPKERLAAPLLKPASNKNPSVLDVAIQACQHDLKHVAEQSSMVIAVADIGSTILWAAPSAQMRSAAEKVHFVAGGQWKEELVGTNALALSLKTRQSSCVFSNEHYMSSVHDWVCYAAPILDPYTQQPVGVVDLSAIWKNHNALGMLAAERCAAIIQNALIEHQRQHLFIRAFSTPQILFNGKALVLTPRQVEILTILTLCPQGLNLEKLHHALYGERKVSVGTLKAEMSQLRDILGGLLGSRPYRLLAHVEADFLQAEDALNAGYVAMALQLYTGVLLSRSESPFICTWRDCLESRLSDAIYKAKEPDMLLKHLARFPEAIDAVQQLTELLPLDHPAHQLLVKYYEE